MSRGRTIWSAAASSITLLLLPTFGISQAATCEPPRDYHGRIARSRAATADFQRHHPCPANGHHRGRCPGYVIDHIQPLCACGADSPTNMQWQTVKDAKAKDRIERETCAAL